MSSKSHRPRAPDELPRSEELGTAMTLLSLIGEKVDVIHPPRSRSDDARVGGDIDCVVESLDELWPLGIIVRKALLRDLERPR